MTHYDDTKLMIRRLAAPGTQASWLNTLRRIVQLPTYRDAR